MPKVAGSPASNKVLRAPRTPKTMPKSMKASARQMSPMEDAASPVPRKASSRRNTMAANALDGNQSKMVRRSARVNAKKPEWDCEDMLPPSPLKTKRASTVKKSTVKDLEDMPPPSPVTTKRAMSVKKSTAKKTVRKTLVCDDDYDYDYDCEVFELPNFASAPPQSTSVSLFSEQQPIGDEKKSENTPNEASAILEPTEAALNESSGEKKNGTFEIEKENVNNVSGVGVLPTENALPSVSMLGAKLKTSTIQSSDSETDTLPSVSLLGAEVTTSDSDHEFLPSVSMLGAKPKAKKVSVIPTPVSVHKKSTRSTRKTVAGDNDGAAGTAIVDDLNASRFQYAYLLKDAEPSADTAPNAAAAPADALNESSGEKKNGTFEISKEHANDVSGVNLLTEDESDAEEQEKLDNKTKKIQSPPIAVSDSDQEALPSVSMLVTGTDRKPKFNRTINANLPIVDLTDSPATKEPESNNKAEAIASALAVEANATTEKINDKTFSPVETKAPQKSISVAPTQPGTSTWLTLPPAGAKRVPKQTKNASPLKVHTPFKRKSPRTSNGASKRPLTSAKKKCLLSMAKDVIAARTSNKQVAFSSPAKDGPRTPNRALSMGIKKTPFRLPAEVAAPDENEVPSTSTAGQKTPGKMPNFGKMHQKLFANMESLDTAIVRVDERAKELLSSKKLPAVANIVKSTGGIGTRRALQPQQNANRFGFGSSVTAASKLHKVTKTITREDRRKQMFKPMAKNNDSVTGRVARTGILKGVRTNRRFELMMQSRELANNH